MSPPQVYLCGKPTAVISEEGMPLEKEDKTDEDSIITVETKGRGNCCKCNRRWGIIFCIAVLAVMAGTVAVVLGVKFGGHHHGEDHYDEVKEYEPSGHIGEDRHHDEVNEYKTNGQFGENRHHEEDQEYKPKRYPLEYPKYTTTRAPGPQIVSCYWYGQKEQHCFEFATVCYIGWEKLSEHVVVREDIQRIEAEHARGSHGEPAIHARLDYQKGYAGYKDLDRNVCFVAALNETFTQGLERWRSYVHSGRELKTLRLLSVKRADPYDVVRIAGGSIRVGCRFGPTFWAAEIEDKDVTPSMTIVKV